MQEEQQHVDQSVDPSSTQLAAETTQDTQSQVEQQSPSELQAGHDNVQTQSESDSSNATSQADEEDAPTRISRLEGKLKQEQEERKKEREAADTYKKQNEAYSTWVLKNPSRAKEALMELDGLSPEEAEQTIKDVKARNPQLWAEVKAEQKQGESQPEDPYKVAEKVIEQKERERRYANEFFSTLPELDPTEITNDTEREEKKQLALQVDFLASTYRQLDPSLDLKTAWNEAYKFKTKKTDADIAEARKQGRIEGMQLANSDAASSTSPATGAQQNLKPSVKLTDLERKMAADLKISESDYAAMKAERSE